MKKTQSNCGTAWIVGLLTGLFLTAAPAHAQSMSDVLSTVCNATATTADTDRKTKCDAAQNLYLDAALQNLTNQQVLQTQAQGNSATAAYIDLLTKLRASIAPNATTLNAISVDGTPTVPKMDASAQAELIKRATAQASMAAQKIPTSALTCSTKDASSPTLLLNGTQLTSSVRSYKSALAAMDLMREQADLVLQDVKSIEKPKQLPRINFGEFESLPSGVSRQFSLSVPRISGAAALGSISLLLDVASNAAALAASMRPQVSVSSGTLSEATMHASHAAYIDALIQRGYVIKDAQEVMPLAHTSSRIRQATRQLDNSIANLQTEAILASSYSYPRITESTPGKGSTTTALSLSPQEVRRDRVLGTAIALMNHAKELKISILTDTTVAGSVTTVRPALINAFDQVEALGLMEPTAASCFYTIKFEAQSANYDQHVKQRFFGSPVYHARVVGRTRVQITHTDGRIAVNDNILVDSGWVGFGPDAKTP